MNFKRDDILVRSHKNGETVWVSQRLLLDNSSITDGYLRRVRSAYKKSVQPCHQHHNVLPDTNKGWRYAKINNAFYYDLKSIPNREPKYYRDLFGDVQQLIVDYNNAINESTASSLETHFKRYLNTVYKDYLSCYLNCKSSKIVHQLRIKLSD